MSCMWIAVLVAVTAAQHPFAALGDGTQINLGLQSRCFRKLIRIHNALETRAAQVGCSTQGLLAVCVRVCV